MITAFQKIIAHTKTGQLSLGHRDYPKHYDWERFRFFEAKEQNKVRMAVIDKFGNVIMGFSPMTFDEAMKIIFNSISEEQIEKELEIGLI